MKESFPSTQSNNALVKPSINSPKRSSVISFTQLKIPCFEWKDEMNLGNKTAEYYLNIYYSQISNGNNKNKYNKKFCCREKGKRRNKY